MRRTSFVLLAMGLAGCTGPVARGPVLPVPPSAPDWAGEPVPGRQIRAIGRVDLPLDAPERLLRDLADARACELVRDSFASRAAEGVRRRVRPGSSDSLSSRLRTAILRTPFSGCAIARRSILNGAQGRRWCWAQAVLDSAELAPVLERELRRLGALASWHSPLDVLEHPHAPSPTF